MYLNWMIGSRRRATVLGLRLKAYLRLLYFLTMVVILSTGHHVHDGGWASN